MKKNKWTLVMLLSSMLLTAVGCSEQAEEKAEPAVAQAEAAPQEQDVMEWYKYNALYIEAAAKLNVPGMKKIKDYTDNPQVILLDEKSVLNNRTVLTLDGNPNSDQATQKRIVYQNEEKGVIAYVDLIYLKKSLNNDTIYWDSSPPDQLDENSITRKFHQSMFTYKNIMVNITYFSTNDQPASAEDHYKVTNAVVDYFRALNNDKAS